MTNIKDSQTNAAKQHSTKDRAGCISDKNGNACIISPCVEDIDARVFICMFALSCSFPNETFEILQ